MALNRANKEPNSVLLTPYITIGSTTIPLGSSSSIISGDLILNGNISLNGTINVTSSTTGLSLYITKQDVWSDGFHVRKRGNFTSPNAAIVNATELGYNAFYGWDGTSYGRGAYIFAVAEQDFSSNNHGSRLTFNTTAIGASDSTERLRIDSAGNVSIANTITAGSVVAGTTANSTSGIGYMGMPQNLNPTTYTLAASDAGKHIYYTTSGQTLTIPANATLALPIGFSCVVVNAAAVTTTIAITTDTLIFAGTGTTGSRTLAPYGMATLLKITSNSWMVTGNGLS
jgi:hypothetical protein